MPYPLPRTRTEAYLAYKAGVIQQSDLKPSLAKPRIGIDDWLAYWTGLKNDYPKNPDGTPKMLQEEEKYIAYLSGVTNEYPEKCLRRVGAYLRYLISARWGRPDHPLNREELYLSLIKTQVIPSGDPSSDIVIDGTAKAPFVDVKMYGDTFQQSYTGQNLYNVAEVTTWTYVTKDDDGWITITRDNTSGSSTVFTNVWTNNLALETSTQYKIFIEVKAVSGTGTLFITSTNSTGTEGQFGNKILAIADMVAGQTYTVSPTTKSSFSGISKGLRTFLQQTAGQGGSVTFRLSVCAYTTPTETFSYEPYTGGQPSPNPDYPQQIQTVTGEQTVSINGTNYPISLGSIELCKLGTYQDYIWKDGEDWKVHKATAIASASNREWKWANVSPNGWYFSHTNYGFYDINKINVISKSFIGVKRSVAPNTSGAFITVAGDGSIGIRNPNITGSSNVTQFTDWLNSLNTTWLYARTTPTNTTITDTTLIAQLEALVAGGAENGTTYIKVSATDPNLPGLLYVEAPKYE